MADDLEQARLRIAALERELAKARVDQETVMRATARLRVLRKPTRSPAGSLLGERPAPAWTLIEEADEPSESVYRAMYAFEATTRQLEALDLVFAMMTTAGVYGSTLFFDVMVDGDGGGHVRVSRIDGGQATAVELAEADARAWLMGEGEVSKSVLDVSDGGDGAIVVEIT